MTKTLWRKKTAFESMMSWFDHELIMNDFDRSLQSGPDAKEKNETYVVKTDMPGLEKKDIHLELKNGILTLRGEWHEKAAHSSQRTRRVFGSFERKLKVPKGVTRRDIRTKYANGVLELTIPVPKAAKRTKEIETETA